MWLFWQWLARFCSAKIRSKRLQFISGLIFYLYRCTSCSWYPFSLAAWQYPWFGEKICMPGTSVLRIIFKRGIEISALITRPSFRWIIGTHLMAGGRNDRNKYFTENFGQNFSIPGEREERYLVSHRISKLLVRCLHLIPWVSWYPPLLSVFLRAACSIG